MTATVIWDTRLKPGAEAEGLRLTRRIWSDMRAFEGYLSHEIFIDQDAQGTSSSSAGGGAERMRIGSRPRDRWITAEDQLDA